MPSTRSLIDMLSVYNIELPSDLEDLPSEFESFSELEQWLRERGEDSVAEQITLNLPLLCEALIQSVSAEPLKLPELPTKLPKLGDTYDEQAFLRLLVCPTVLAKNPDKALTLDDLYTDPVTTPDGNTYEREHFVTAWQALHKDAPIPEGLLVTNLEIKKLVNELRETEQIKDLDFKELFEDQIDLEPMKKPMVMDTNGDSFGKESIGNWLSKREVCPNNPDLSCIWAQLRDNKLLEHVYDYYRLHIYIRPTPEQALRPVIESINSSNLQHELNQFFDDLNYISEPKEGSRYIQALNNLTQKLSLLFYCYTHPKFQTGRMAAELSNDDVIQYLMMLHKTIFDAVRDQKALIDYYGSHHRLNCLSLLNDFKNQIVFRQKCLNPDEQLIVAKVKPSADHKIDTMGILRNESREVGTNFVLILKSTKQNAKHAEVIAKCIASAVKSSMQTFPDSSHVQYQVATKQLAVILLAIKHLHLMDRFEIDELKTAMPEELGNLDEFSQQPNIEKMYKKLDSDIKKADSPGFWSQVSSFFRGTDPQNVVSEASSPSTSRIY